MAGLGATDSATTAIIEDSEILRAFVYQQFYTNGTYGFRKWDSNQITFTMNKDDTADPDGQTVAPWDPLLTTAIYAAVAEVESVADVTFTEVADTNNAGTDGADIDFWYYNNPNDGASGYSYGVAGKGTWIDEDSVFDFGGTSTGLTYGGVNYRTVIHELLHNMGLSHPHDRYDVLPGVTRDDGNDLGDFNLSQNLYTVMSYNRTQQVDANGEQTTGWPFTTTTVDQSFGVIGAFDIAVLQVLYGANMTHNTGDDIYDIPTANGDGVYFKSIWDAGGIDTFRFQGSDGVRIDLRAATLDIDDGMLAGGIASRVVGVYGGFTIANGAVIENAIGGSGDDTITGNDAENTITGAQGLDTIYGGKGADDIRAGSDSDSIYGGDQGDVILGQGGGDLVEAGEGADDVSGGTGNDYLYGGQGRDTVDGGDGADVLRGQAGADVISGGRGDDDLGGGDAKDTLTGGGGGDTLSGGADDDDLSGGAAGDTLDGDGGADILKGGDGGDLLRGGAGADDLRGQKGRDTLEGGTGADRLKGGAGNDTLTGGSGADVFAFDGNNDEGTDRITDWEDGTDRIEISGAPVFADLSITKGGGDTRVAWDTNVILVQGFTGTLDAADFDFV